jgi:ATP-dependent Clp protease adaptor protein ClpS
MPRLHRKRLRRVRIEPRTRPGNADSTALRRTTTERRRDYDGVRHFGRFFGMSNLEAITHMLRIHEEGKAICGTYWCDEARKKVADVLAFAGERKHPLRCILEEAD